MCLSTSCKALARIIGKYVIPHTKRNGIWNKEQLRVVEGVLSRVGQLITDMCIMKEMEQYHVNLTALFYEYKRYMI